MSMQSQINKDPSKIKALVVEMLEKGWKETTFDMISTGDQIRYIRRQEDGTRKYISGGICVVKESDHLVYKGGPRLWSLQKSDVIMIWSFQRHPKKKKTGIINLKVSSIGNFTVEHDGQVIYRASKKRDADNFIRTQKYQRIVDGAEFTIQ